MHPSDSCCETKCMGENLLLFKPELPVDVGFGRCLCTPPPGSVVATLLAFLARGWLEPKWCSLLNSNFLLAEVWKVTEKMVKKEMATGQHVYRTLNALIKYVKSVAKISKQFPALLQVKWEM